MEQVKRVPEISKRRVLIGTLILLASQVVLVAILRQSGASAAGELAGSAVVALSILAIGALNAAQVTYPAWAYRSMVGIMAASVLIPSLLGLTEGRWSLGVRSDLWSLPWYLVVLSSMPASRRTACAGRSQRVGLFMVGATLLLVALMRADFWLRLIQQAGWLTRGAI